MFFKSFIDKKGKVEKNSYKIAKRYLKSRRFLFDFLAFLGNNIFVLINPVFAFFGFFKIVRIVRVNEFINKFNFPKSIKALASLLKIGLYLLLTLHLIACIWFWSVD
jgi:hypothetical protein